MRVCVVCASCIMWHMTHDMHVVLEVRVCVCVCPRDTREFGTTSVSAAGAGGEPVGAEVGMGTGEGWPEVTVTSLPHSTAGPALTKTLETAGQKESARHPGKPGHEPAPGTHAAASTHRVGGESPGRKKHEACSQQAP